MAQNLINNYQHSILNGGSDSDGEEPSHEPVSTAGPSSPDIESGPNGPENGPTSKTESPNESNKMQSKPTPKPKEEGQIDPKIKKDDLNMIVLNQARININNSINITTMNDFYRRALRQIITELFHINEPNMKNQRSKTAEDLEIQSISFSVKYTDVNLTKPLITTGKDRGKLLTPQNCRDSGTTYSSTLYISVKVETSAKFKSGREEKRSPVVVKDLPVGNIPIMLRSEYCTLDGCTDEDLFKLGEDPNDHGGYFVVEGIHRFLPKTENLAINKIHVYKNEFRTQKARLTFQSKPGDGYENSAYMVIILHTTGEIYIEITISGKVKIIVPFYVVFRAYGMTVDQDIVEHITYSLDSNDTVVKRMLDILYRAFKAPTVEFYDIKDNPNPEDNLMELVKRTTNLVNSSNINRDPNIKKHLNHKGYKILDFNILPHIGNTPDSRIKKVRYLGHMINKLLLCQLGVINSTDRDHLQNKIIALPSINMAKTIKTVFNFVINKDISNSLTNAFNNNPWRDVDLSEVIKNAIKPQSLEKYIIGGIKSGEKSIKIQSNTMKNKIVGQQLMPKNQCNILSSLNSIITHGEEVASKSNDRSMAMRMPHSSFLNYVGMMHSTDTGEKIGTVKQMAIMATLTEGSNSTVLKEIVLKNPEVIKYVMPREIGENKLWKIFVNGDWIGVCKDGDLINKFRAMRRAGEIDRKTIIAGYPIEREISFRTDVGYFIVPYIIVYNNIEAYIRARRAGDKEFKFKQWINLKAKHITALKRGEIDVSDLVDGEIMEYIGAEEADNMLLCENLDLLRREQGNVLNQYTHLDIEAAFHGILEIASPYSNHTACSRITMYINQKKQSAGWPVLNWFNRYERLMHLQFYCSTPTVITLTAALPLLPTSENAIVAYMINSGYNQEDSLVLNKSSIDRGYYVGSNFYFEKVELEKGEQFGNPGFELTINKTTGANRENIVDGFIKEGVTVNYGDVLIVKTSKLNKEDPKNITDEHNNYKYIDSSIIYKFSYPSVVEKVIHLPGSNTATVKLRNCRPINVGDKMASQHGCKGVVGAVFNEAQMPYTEDGLIPDIIVNPHSIPTRMGIGQMIETVVATLAAKKGVIVDGTPFKSLDLDAIIEELKAYGVENACMRRMYNGRYGNWYDSLIFIGPTTYHRLLKFVMDEAYAMNTGPTDALTRQPVEGKSKGGGLRFGEMEKDALITHGTMLAVYEIFYKNSDGIDIYICKTCKNRAIVNQKAGLYKCLYCQGEENIYRVPCSFSTNLTLNEIQSMNVKLEFELEDNKMID